MIDLIKDIILTEKTEVNIGFRQYTFRVDTRLTKTKIKTLIEQLYNVQVQSVNTHCLPRKKRRSGAKYGLTKKYKKAIIRLKPGSKLNLSS